MPQHRIEASELDDALRIDLSFHLIGALVFVNGSLSSVRMVRTDDRPGEGPNHHRFVLPISGRLAGEAGGVPFAVEAGDVGLLDLSSPFALNSDGCEYITVLVERETLATLMPDAARLHGIVLRSARARIFGDHLRALARHLDTLEAEEAELVGRATLGLMAASLDGIARLPAPAAAGVKSAIRLHVERYIEGNLSSPDLTPEIISRDLEIPRSTLYRAFEPLGGISSYIQSRRLDTAWTLLTHPEEHRPIGKIAEALGFDSASRLSKAFQRRFGFPPRKARQRGSSGTGNLRSTFERWASIVEEERQLRDVSVAVGR